MYSCTVTQASLSLSLTACMYRYTTCSHYTIHCHNLSQKLMTRNRLYFGDTKSPLEEDNLSTKDNTGSPACLLCSTVHVHCISFYRGWCIPWSLNSCTWPPSVACHPCQSCKAPPTHPAPLCSPPANKCVHIQRISKIFQQESQKQKWLESTDWSDCSYEGFCSCEILYTHQQWSSIRAGFHTGGERVWSISTP